MAHTKEAIVIILDVGKNSTQVVDGNARTFLEKEKECCTKLLQKKIFEAKKDEIALILMGSETTQNRCADENAGFENICEAFNLAIPNWNLVRAVNSCESDEMCSANWMDAIQVGIDLLKHELKNKRFGNLKIVLFTSFASVGERSTETSDIIEELKNMSIELIVISDNIEFCFQGGNERDDGGTQAHFSQVPHKTSQQQEAEQLILQIIEETDGNLTSFDYLIDHLTTFQRKRARPSFWYSQLEIGKDFQIAIAATILIKHEQHFKFKMASKNEDHILRLDNEFYRNGEKVDISAEDTIKGYMIGSTPIAYDETLGNKKTDTVKGLRCIAFTKTSMVPPQIICGNGTYMVVAKEGDGRSQKLFRLLVKAMDRLDFAMIGIRVYLNGSKPKLVVLKSNLTASLPALNMYELAYADQVHHWYFPQLCTKKSQPSPEQYDAIDKLIDSMDLMDAGDFGKEAFPFDKLVSPIVQHIYESVTKRALDPAHKVEVFDNRLEQALKIPEIIVERSAEPRSKVKELFQLQEPKVQKKELVRKLCQISAEADGGPITLRQDEVMDDVKRVLEVGTVNPEEDFKNLMNQDENAFPRVADQLGNVLYDLIFKSLTDQSEKVCDCMMTFREFAKFYGPYVYTEWIRTIKESVLTRRKLEFWEDVVVKNHLGLISTSESDKVVSVTDEEGAEFYRINVGSNTAAGGQDDEADVDDLFGQM